jgi:hypothetical protein
MRGAAIGLGKNSYFVSSIQMLPPHLLYFKKIKEKHLINSHHLFRFFFFPLFLVFEQWAGQHESPLETHPPAAVGHGRLGQTQP